MSCRPASLRPYGFSLWPVYQYVQPCNYQTRTTIGAIDIGAYEY